MVRRNELACFLWLSVLVLAPCLGQTQNEKPPVAQSPAVRQGLGIQPEEGPNAEHHDMPRHGRVPSARDGEMRLRMEKLFQLDDAQAEGELQKWPKYQTMSDEQKNRFRQRLSKMRERRRHAAERKAKQLGLNVPADKMTAFEKSYWEKRLKADHELWKEIEPKRKAADEQVNAQMLKEFGAYKETSPTSSPSPVHKTP